MVKERGALVHLPHSLVLAAVRCNANLLSLVGVVYHAIGVPELYGDVGQRNVQRSDFRMLWAGEHGEEQQGALRCKPSLRVPLQREEVDAEADVSPGGLSRVQSQNALAEGNGERATGTTASAPHTI